MVSMLNLPSKLKQYEKNNHIHSSDCADDGMC